MSNITQEPTHTIHDIALSPSYISDGVGYAASQAGLFKTTNYCSGWEQVGEPILLTKLLYTPDLILVSSIGHISKSTTNGNTWKTHPLPLPTSVASALIVHGDCILIGTMDDGVLISEDNGETWRGWNFGLLDWRVLSLADTSQEIVYLGTETGLFYSRNGGKSWQETIPEIQSPVLSLLACEDDMLVATEAGRLLRVSPDNNSITPLFESENAINALALSQKNQLAILDDTTILVSHDSGQSWTPTNTQVEDATTLTWATKNMLIVGNLNGVLAKILVD